MFCYSFADDTITAFVAYGHTKRTNFTDMFRAISNANASTASNPVHNIDLQWAVLRECICRRQKRGVPADEWPFLTINRRVSTYQELFLGYRHIFIYMYFQMLS